MPLSPSYDCRLEGHEGGGRMRRLLMELWPGIVTFVVLSLFYWFAK